ncbi:MAG: preprotein translocase subunit SecG [Phycisphaerales bacterium]
MPVLALDIPVWSIGLMVVVFLFVSLCMILIVLIQRPQGGGIAGAFGGGGAEGAGQTAFGAKTGDVLTTVTIGIFVVFIGSAIALNYMVRPPKAAPATVGAPAQSGPSTPAGAGTAAPEGAAPAGTAPVTTPETSTPATETPVPVNPAPVENTPAPAAAPAAAPASEPAANPIPTPANPQ